MGNDGFSGNLNQRIFITRQPCTSYSHTQCLLDYPVLYSRQVIDQAIIRSADATENWIADGISSAMNRFNG